MNDKFVRGEASGFTNRKQKTKNTYITKLSVMKAIVKQLLTAIALILFASPLLAQTVYTTTTDGDWNTSSTWTGSNKPSNPLAASDTIKIQHKVDLDIDAEILGVLIVEAGDTIHSSNSSKLQIGKGGTSSGILYNYGHIEVLKIEVKPDNGCSESATGLPNAFNYGSMVLTDLHVGNNCGRGAFFNMVGGSVTVSDEVHLDNRLYNKDTMIVQTKVKNHGGYIGNCGYIITPYIDADPNTGRPATFDCIDFCEVSGGSTDPDIDVGSSSYTDLASAYAGASSSDAVFDQDSTLFCGYNESGTAVTLPVRLLYFNAELKNSTINVNWATSYESNSSHFVVETAASDLIFEEATIVGAQGESVQIVAYSTDIPVPDAQYLYLRLRQVDLNGEFEYSPTIGLDLSGMLTRTKIYPNPSLPGQRITVRTTKQKPAVSMEVWGMDGKLVKNLDLNSGMSQLESLGQGIYTVQFKDRTGKVIQFERFVQF